MKWICDHRSESQFKQLRNSPKRRFFAIAKIAIHCDGHIFISDIVERKFIPISPTSTGFFTFKCFIPGQNCLGK